MPLAIILEILLSVFDNKIYQRGVEQWKLVGLITRRSLVRIQPPLPMSLGARLRRLCLSCLALIVIHFSVDDALVWRVK